ncbi:F-box/kelch-repeat protein At3g06240-like [Arachis duranensis]|uniref:F-box/kelch-repeat protein At3g06240-like n=1 Tax=Arachis duranensis TaxID=130453 RepID=A0A6P4D6M6_ARADU|nr:F-box/kelch-repeat protein At3g06240-like [Arachis duranensis]
MTLPPELLEIIFLRLPVRSLIQFKCVCKQWRSLISDPYFAKLHYDVAIAPTHNNNTKLLYLSSDFSRACCVKTEPSIHHDYPFKLQETYKNHSLRIIGSCRGFVLLRNYKPKPVLILWNPATGSHVRVPYPNNSSNSEFPCPDFFCHGVVYEKSNDDYLVIMGSVRPLKRKPEWKFFSVRSNSWKEIEGGDCFTPNISMGHQLGLLYNEAIHWLAVYNGSDYPRGIVIVAFDIATKTLSMIPLPYPQDPSQWELSLVGGAGFFGICMLNEFWPYIFVMKEYKVESSWILIDMLLPSDNTMIPLCFTQSGDVVWMNRINKDLIKFGKLGSNEEELQEFKLDFCDKDTVLVMFNESLLSLPSSCRQEE